MYVRSRLAAAALLALLWVSTVEASNTFVPIAPCRAFDSRFAAGGILAPGSTRMFRVTGSTGFETQGGKTGGCGVPQGATEAVATAVMVNIVAVGPTGPGHLVGWAVGTSMPDASVINYASAAATGGLNIANGIIIPINGTAAASGDLNLRAFVSSTHVLGDVTGYFVEAPAVESDITSVTASTGLEGGATEGDATLAIAPTFRLPQGCSGGQIVSWNGSEWVCAADAAGAGDITGVSAGTGLAGGATSGDAALDLASSYRLPQGCDTGKIASWNGSTWECSNGPGSVLGFSRSSVYTVSVETQAEGGGTTVATAACSDATDIPLSGNCRVVPGGISTVRHSGNPDWTDQSAPAQFTCRYVNSGVDDHNTQTTIHCLTAP